MRARISMLAAALSMVVALDAATANLAEQPQPAAEAPQPPILVLGPRIVCRPVAKTATRLDLSARCVTENASPNTGATTVNSYRDVDHLSDRLAIITRQCGTCWKD